MWDLHLKVVKDTESDEHNGRERQQHYREVVHSTVWRGNQVRLSRFLFLRTHRAVVSACHGSRVVMTTLRVTVSMKKGSGEVRNGRNR